MSSDSLMSYLKFNANIYDYAPFSTSQKSSGSENYSSYDTFSEKSDDTKNFSDFVKSAQKIDNSDKSSGYDNDNAPATTEKSRKSEDIKIEFSEKRDVSDTDDTREPAKTPDKSANKETEENTLYTADNSEGNTALATDKQNPEKIADAATVEHIAVTQVQRFSLDDLADVKSNGDGSVELIESSCISLACEEVGDTLDNLNKKIQALIDTLIEKNDDALSVSTQDNSDTCKEVETLQPRDIIEDSEADTEALFELLGALIKQIGESESAETDNSENTDVAGTILSKLQCEDSKDDEDGKNADLTAILSDLAPEDLEDLKEQINTYLSSNDLSPEEQEDLAELIAQYYPTSLTTETSLTQFAVGPSISSPQPSADPSANPITSPVNIDSISSSADHNDVADSDNETTSKTIEQSAVKTDTKTGRAEIIPEQSDDEISFRVNADEGDIAKDTATKTKEQKGNVIQQQGQASAGERFLQASGNQQITTLAENNAALSSQNTVGSGTVSQAQGATLDSAGIHAQSTGHTHPATQMVSITMQKALKAGEDTTIKLQLDPPELGRVEVKMSIDQDNTAKIVLTSERAETHQMLQRDSAFLERAMSDAGLDAGGNLSFELASGEQNFGESSGSGGSSSGMSSFSDSDIESETIVQANTMDWYIDPNTGRMHYNILA